MNPQFFIKALLFTCFLWPCVVFSQSKLLHDSTILAKLKKNDVQGAMQLYDKAIKADTSDYNLFIERGNLRVKLNNYQGSIDDYTKAINFVPDAKVFYLRGISYYMLQDYKNAMADFEATLQHHPDIEVNYEAYFLMGNIKFKQEDMPGSIVEYTKSIELKPNYAKAYYNRGVSKYFGNQKHEACKDINKAKELGFTNIGPAIKKYCDYYSTH